MSQRAENKEKDKGRPLERVLDALLQLGQTKEKVTVADVQEEIGQRSFGPFLFVPAVLEISPLGGVPGVPTLLGLIVAITAAQMLFGRRHFWLPGFISRRSIKGERIEPAVQKMRPVMRLVDKGLRPRLQHITQEPWSRVVAGICLLCALTVPPLELVPFASTAPFVAIALIGLGLTGRDGLFVWVGVITAIVSLYLLSYPFR